MASKTKVRIPLQELSVEEDSGWRALDASHVTALMETVRGGSWGQTTLVRPSVLQVGEKKCTSATDGRYVLNNGLHAVMALKKVAAELETMDESPTWVNEELAEIFAGSGLLVDVVEYSSQDRTARCVIQAVAHEQDQNRYRPTTLKNKVDIVSHIYLTVKDWSLVTKQLVEVMGASKRSTVQRWVTLARDLDADVLTEIQAKRPTLPQEFVIGNKFLIGRGESHRFRLSAKYASVAIEWLLDLTGAIDGVSSDNFVNEFCLPAKTLELWEQSTIKRFGVVADSFKPFHRVVQSLQKNGRARIIACIRQRMPLGGGGKTEPGTSVGIDECKAVLDELSKMKAGASPSTATEGHPALAESQGMDAAAAEPSCAADGDDGEYADLLTVGGEAGAAEDFLAKEIQAEVSKQLVHVAIHGEKASFLSDCTSRIVSEERAIIYVETPSSKAKFACDFLKIASELPTARTAAVFVPVGGRLALLCNVAASVKKWFPGRQMFTVTIGADHQSARSRTSFGIYVPIPSVHRDVPSSLSSTGCRATAIEGLRMRCKSETCRFRPARDDRDGDLDFQEVCPDDIPSDGEKDAADGFEEEVDGDDGEDVVDEDRGKAAGDATKLLANLFPVAYPVSLHLMILGALRAASMSHLFLLTRTPHPGLQVAARELGLEVVVLLNGPSSGRATRELHELTIQGRRAQASEAKRRQAMKLN